MRKAVFVLALFALLITSVSVMAQDEIVVDFYYPTAVDAPINQIIQGYADAFHEANPSITINPVYTGSYTQTRDTIRTELNGGGAGPDVAVMLSTDVYSFAEEGSILPAQQFIDAMEGGEAFVNDFFPAFLLNSMDAEGTIWSVPFQRSTPILYYNVDMLAEAGFDAPPTNRDEMLAMAQALTLPNGERWGLLVPFAGGFPIWMFQAFAIGNGRNITGEDPATVYMNDPLVIDALEFSTKLGTEFGVGPLGGSVWGDTPTAFLNGQAAMIMHTTGSMTNILNNATFEVGAAFVPFGIPGEDGTGYGTPTGGGNLYVFSPIGMERTQEELDAAWLWVEYLSSPEVQSDWGAATGYIAARQSAWELDPLAALAAERPQYLVARDQLQYASAEFTSYRAIDVQNIINASLSGVISGAEPDAAAAMASAQEQIDSLLAEYR
ncbi:MAG: ABC transporter substrate-binding protein [Anaerolinea sp.]|nr:ABC transporter substrate-binding protein [Anaerolinea sp.]